MNKRILDKKSKQKTIMKSAKHFHRRKEILFDFKIEGSQKKWFS